MNKKLPCIFGLLLLFYTTSAQKNYKQALVVLSNGDLKSEAGSLTTDSKSKK